MTRARTALMTSVVIMMVGLTACASQPPGQPGEPAFFAGLWHGLIAPIAFVVSMFDDSVRAYAFPNAGRWYDFGFLLGLSGWGGGAGAASRR
jgi:hypothetical protein